MTRPIAEILATLPSGRLGIPLGEAEMGAYLKKHYGGPDEEDRRARHKRRDEMFRDGGCEYMRGVVNEMFEDDGVKARRRAWVPHARFSNSLKRIVREVSTVYAEPATRTVGGGEANEKKFADLAEAVLLDEVMEHANHMLNLHRAVLIGPRVWVDEDGAPSLAIDVVSPANAFAVVHPNNTTRVIGWGIKVEYRSARTEWVREPAWQLWTAHEVMFLDKDFVPIGGTAREHGLGVNPWLALTYSAEAVAGFWPGEEGEDLVAAQVSIWFAGILLLKETKSATKMPQVIGDTSAAPRGQPLDSDVPAQFGEGVSVQTVDMSMDPAQFTAPSDHVLQRTGANYGLSMGMLAQEGTQSAEARELMLEPLRHLRRKQIKTFRRAERALVSLIVAVLKVDAPALVFEVVAFGVNFGEPQVLTNEAERLANYEKRKALGFDNPVAYYRKYVDPDCPSDAAAINAITRNVEHSTLLVRLMKDLMALSGALGAEAARADTGQTANGEQPA